MSQQTRFWFTPWIGCLLAVIAISFAVAFQQAAAREPRPLSEVHVSQLPVEAQQTLALIKRGGPYPYRKDGTVFHNRERRLPPQPRGYYREYTVPTPGSADRGARRIVSGGARDTAVAGEYYYTADHYRSFRRIRE